MPAFSEIFLGKFGELLRLMDPKALDPLLRILCDVRTNCGRLFMIGVGGSAANCSHAVNDFRKLAYIEAYAPTDNVSELTARTNDDGWGAVFAGWLRGSHLRKGDAIFVLSVGGGETERNISPNIVEALRQAKLSGAKILGIVGRDGGATASVSDVCIVVPTVDPGLVTPFAESMQTLLLHLLVSHPILKCADPKWEASR